MTSTERKHSENRAFPETKLPEGELKFQSGHLLEDLKNRLIRNRGYAEKVAGSYLSSSLPDPDQGITFRDEEKGIYYQVVFINDAQHDGIRIVAETDTSAVRVTIDARYDEKVFPPNDFYTFGRRRGDQESGSLKFEVQTGSKKRDKTFENSQEAVDEIRRFLKNLSSS